MLKLAVIGSPISHSLSPEIHGAALESLGIEYSYEKTEVKKGELEKFLAYAKNNLDGFNLTMPHKVDVLPCLDGISDEAKMFASVNTVRVKDGRLYGHNTDADGYVQAMRNRGYTPENKDIVILGAGGVVRTLAKKLSVCGAKRISVLNRTIEKAEEIVKDIKEAEADFGEFSVGEIARRCETADILINATPLGMEGSHWDFEDTSFLKRLKSGALVSDLIYAPEKTKFLADAERLGFEIMNGFGMLIFQAILADAIYLEKALDLQKVYSDVIKKIK